MLMKDEVGAFLEFWISCFFFWGWEWEDLIRGFSFFSSFSFVSFNFMVRFQDNDVVWCGARCEGIESLTTTLMKQHCRGTMIVDLGKMRHDMERKTEVASPEV